MYCPCFGLKDILVFSKKKYFANNSDFQGFVNQKLFYSGIWFCSEQLVSGHVFFVKLKTLSISSHLFFTVWTYFKNYIFIILLNHLF